MENRFILTLTCTDVMGIVANVSGFLFEHQCNIAESQQFWDQESNTFFMRVEFLNQSGHPLDVIKAQFKPLAQQFGMHWDINDANRPMRTLILVSKFDHCLHDLLYKTRTDALHLDICGVVSNHKDCASLVKDGGYMYHYLPILNKDKEAQEAQIIALIEEQKIEFVILARYMQILSNNLCNYLSHKAINIHHSFLPGFKGARPYARAFERGVKLIGATAHYVTADLDEGPIIEQDTARVDHSHHASELVVIGRDIEAQTLAKAVKYHSEHRILLNGAKTVIFR